MPDWRRLVERRLRKLRAPGERRDEIERELAGFLEDRYERRLREGRPDRAAMRDAIASVGGWSELAGALGREEAEMGGRIKTLWMPGFVVAVAALLLSRLPHAQWGGMSVVRLPSYQSLVFIWTWMLMLPLVAAAGAEWSRRHGGGRREQMSVALFPAFALLVIFALTMLLFGHPASQYPSRGPIPGRLLVFVNFVLIPTLPLLLGCLPTFLRRDRRAPAEIA